MTCLLWRQHRGQLLWTVLILAAYGVFMIGVARGADGWLSHYHDYLGQLRSAGCPLPDQAAKSVPARCAGLLSRYPDGPQTAFVRAYNFAIPAFEEGLPLVMVLIAALWGAPLVAREVEQRTHLVAWTQSVPRRRWYAAKVGVLAAALTMLGLAAGVANDRLQIPLTKGGLTSSRWPWFFSIDLAPAVEALLAFALAVAIGAWLRRTLPAIGAALIGFLAVFLLTGWAVRSLTPLSHDTGPRRGVPDGGWIVGSGLYHPASQYWPLQLTYAAMLLLAVTALLTTGWYATRTRGI